MKKILIITIILLCFLFVNVVSAANPVKQDIYVAVNGNDTSNTGTNVNSPYATIAKGVSDVNDSSIATIHLSEGTFTGNGNINVTVNKAHQSQGGSLTIIGAGYNKTFIDGNMNFMFNIQADSIVKLVNITFSNGKNQNGGTIVNAGDLSIDNCIFERNYATSSGGAIRSTSGSLNVSNSIFNNNSAGSSYGAITAALSNISNCTFTNNYANNGGAVGINGNSNNGSVIKNSYFANNYAKSSNGGSLFISYVSLINNTIINSTVLGTSSRGGAVYISSGTNYLYNNTMVNCSAVTGNYIYLNSGNVNANIIFADLTVTKPKATVTATVADDMGHPIYGGSISFYSDNILLGSGSVVNGTTAVTYIKLLDNGLHSLNGVSTNFNNLSSITNGTLTVNIDRTPVYFYVSPTGNDGTGDGSVGSPYLTISKAIHEGFNKSIYPTIYILKGTYSGTENTNISITDLGVLNLIGEYNKTIIDGSNLYGIFKFDQYTQVNMENLTFKNCNGTSDYPVLYSTANMNITNCIFENNYATYISIVYASGSVNTVKNLFFKDNQVFGSSSGTFYIKNGTIDNSSFINNSNIGSQSGAMRAGALNADNGLVLTNSYFINNTNNYNGEGAGAVSVQNGNLISINNTFSNNHANGWGGAVGGGITSVNDTFSGNTAGINGGAVYGGGNITNARFINNTAGALGGAIYAYSLAISNCYFVNNTAGINGNEMYIYSSSSTGTISGVNLTFVGNNTVNINKITDDVTATITDDKGNAVSGGYVSFYLNGNYIGRADVINGLATLTYIGFKNGTYNLTGTYSCAVDPVYTKSGVVKVAVTELDSVEYYVSKSGNDTVGDGSKANPFLTIQKALTTGLEFSRNITLHLLEGVYSGVGNVNVTLPGTMNITLIGDGVGKSVIDGEKVNWIFNVTTGDGLISLKDFQIINSCIPYYPGISIYNSPIMIAANSTVVIRNMDFSNNYGFNGGAINNQGDLTINNTNFIGNWATTTRTSGYNGGGAIFNDITGVLKMYNVSIINNNATSGTGIYNAGDLFIKDSLIQSNRKTSSFGNWGSAIFSIGSNALIVNCTFTNNTNYDVYFVGNLGNIYNSTFYNSTGILVGSSAGNHSVYDSTFKGITNAITLQNYKETLTIFGCLFTNNTYTISGGAGTVTISNCVILNPMQVNSNVNLTADYNWWGNNTKPVIIGPDNLNLEYWLVMTLVSDNKPGFTKNIKASIDHYTDGIINYRFDGYLPVRDYLFSVSDGSINPLYGSLVDNVVNAVFNVHGYGSYLVNVTVDNQTLSIPFDVFQSNSTTTVSLSNSTGKRGNTITITVEVKDAITGEPISGGEVEFFIGNTSIGKVQVVNGRAVKQWLVDRDTGEYEINARYLGTDSFKESDDGKLYLVDNIAPSVNTTRNGGTFKNAQNVTLTSDDPTATIYYTTDGTNPTTSSAKYLGPIRITGSMLLRYFAVDSVGNPSQIYTQSYIIDMIAPTVVKVDPVKNAVVKSAKTIKVTFSEPIKAGSKVWVDLKNSTGTILKVTSTIKGNTLTITPSKALGNGKYSLSIHTGSVTDMVGNAFALYSSAFSVDGVVPKVSKVDPVNGATKISAGKTIKISFNEAIKAGSKVWVELKNSSNKAVAFKYSISGKVLTIDPKSNLAESLYTLIIHTGAVTDLAGNPVAAKSYKFSVGTAPKVSKVDPKNGVNKVARIRTIKITFNENIKAANGSKYWVELKTNNGKSVKIGKSITGKVLTIKHTKLAANTKYQLIIHSGAVTDKAGNPVAAKTYKFTTGKT